jgi:hypothetical protein
LLVVLGLVLLLGLLAACEKGPKGPEAEVTVRAVVGRIWRDDDPVRFEVMDSVGNRYEVYVNESTIVNSEIDTGFQGETTGWKDDSGEFAWSDLRQGYEMDLWLNEIDKDKGHKPKHYIALRIDISATPRS